MSCYVKVNGQFKVKDLRPMSHTNSGYFTL